MTTILPRRVADEMFARFAAEPWGMATAARIYQGGRESTFHVRLDGIEQRDVVALGFGFVIRRRGGGFERVAGAVEFGR